MIGIVLLFNCLANMLGSFVAGWAYDHFNPYYLIIAGAGLDVFEKEPLPSTSPIYCVDPQKIVFTPHVAWGSVEARHRLILEVRENIIAFIKGEDRNNC